MVGSANLITDFGKGSVELGKERRGLISAKVAFESFDKSANCVEKNGPFELYDAEDDDDNENDVVEAPLPIPPFVRAKIFEKPAAPPSAPAPAPAAVSYLGPAYFFHCNSKTRPECVQRKLFGGPQPGRYKSVAPGAVLFLFNVDKKSIEGPFKAITKLQQNIVPEAWNGRFSWQCQVSKVRVCEERSDADVIIRHVKSLLLTPLPLSRLRWRMARML